MSKYFLTGLKCLPNVNSQELTDFEAPYHSAQHGLALSYRCLTFWACSAYFSQVCIFAMDLLKLNTEHKDCAQLDN